MADSLYAGEVKNFNDDWRFIKGDPEGMTVNMTLLPVRQGGGRRGGAAQPVEEVSPLWAYVLPTGNDFIKDPAKRYARPAGNPVEGVSYLSASFNDSAWRKLDLPHDFGVESDFIGPGQPGANLASGGTGRLPFYGQAWYRKHMELPAADSGKQIYLDVDGAMSYATVFCNGQIVGGWPYGYASWRVDLTPFVKFGGDNVIAIRIDNPPNSSRWYPGGGIYRSVWLVKTNKTHVAQWGTYVTTPKVSKESADVKLRVTVQNDKTTAQAATVMTDVYALEAAGKQTGAAVATFANANVQVPAGGKANAEATITFANPKLWHPNSPNRYVAVTKVIVDNEESDTYETPFGIRTVEMIPDKGMFINGEFFKMNGVCNHHDLGAIGTAVNVRALERQLQILREMGCNAIRTSHNPPTPELLDMADRMGFVVMDESFDTWRGTKSPNDYGRIFDQWHEQDMRMLVRRDKNHPSVVMWSVGNEVGEQGGGEAGAAVARELIGYVREEDSTRIVTSAANSATPGSPYAKAMDAIGLNYQGIAAGQWIPVWVLPAV